MKTLVKLQQSRYSKFAIAFLLGLVWNKIKTSKWKKLYAIFVQLDQIIGLCSKNILQKKQNNQKMNIEIKTVKHK